MARSLKEYILENGILDQEKLAEYQAKARDLAKTDNYTTLGELLEKDGIIDEETLKNVFVEVKGTEYIDLDGADIRRSALEYFQQGMLRKYGIVPFQIFNNTLYVAMKDPTDLMAVEYVRKYYRNELKIFTAKISAVDRALNRAFGRQATDRAAEEMRNDYDPDARRVQQSFEIHDEEDESDSATIRFVNSIIKQAIDEGASDIHIEPTEEESVARIRVDGILRDIFRSPIETHEATVARIKVMSEMDVTETRIPQDGRATVKTKDEDLDLRVSSLPTVWGEKVVIRLLKKSSSSLDKTAIGLRGDDMEKYEKLLQNHNGVILMVGPTGSGKSTTMVTMMKVLNTRDVNIMSLENPVEYYVPGVNQVQINEKKKLTFALGLRAAMRQDPDIICVGEIRDEETADIAMRAAITGHLVISTLHTNDAISSFERLRDIGVDPYLIGAGVIGIISQRLVRKICPSCREEVPMDEEAVKMFGYDPVKIRGHKFYKGKGCPLCNQTGYRGRTGVFEILIVTPEIRRAVSDNVSFRELKAIADQSGYKKLKDACMDLVLDGVTTFDEMKRTINVIE